MIRYLINLFLGVDQLLNTILLGHPDETISSRLGRSEGAERYFWVGYLRKLVNVLFFFDAEEDMDHCKKSIMPLEQRNFRRVVDYELWDWGNNEAILRDVREWRRAKLGRPKSRKHRRD